MTRFRSPLSDPNYHFLVEGRCVVGGGAITPAAADERGCAVKGKLKVGLLVDGPEVPKYLYDLIEWSRGTDSIQITHLIIQDRSVVTRSLRTRMQGVIHKGLASHAQTGLWRLKDRLESRRLTRIKAFSGYDRTYDTRPLVCGEIHIKPQVSASGFVYRFSDEDVARVRGEEFDLLLRCGSGILRGPILASARLGILSFHHGDNRINRGGPAGFWEIYHRQERTGFVLQRLTEELDGGDVILRGYIPTQDTHLLNSATLYAKSFYRLRGLLTRIAQTGELPEPGGALSLYGEAIVSAGVFAGVGVSVQTDRPFHHRQGPQGAALPGALGRLLHGCRVAQRGYVAWHPPGQSSGPLPRRPVRGHARRAHLCVCGGLCILEPVRGILRPSS